MAGQSSKKVLIGKSRLEHLENLKEAFEERAAIMEFDGGLSRREAERQAFAIVYGAQGAGGTRQRENRKT